MPGFIAKKLGMTRVLTEAGEFVPVTLLDVRKNTIAQVKTEEKDGVNALVLTRPVTEAGKTKKKKQFRVDSLEGFEKDSAVTLDVCDEITEVHLTGTTKGRGFQGVVKRYNFGGGRATHGGKYRKAPGSIGTRKPTRTMRGRKLPGHMGDITFTKKRVPLIEVDKDRGVLAVKGSVPGATNSIVFVTLA